MKNKDFGALDKQAADKKILSYLGLATKAGFAASGEFLTEKSVKEGRACVVLIADDASDNTKKRFTDMCTFYNVPVFCFSDKDTIGHSMGKEFRASLAVNDKGFADQIIKLLETQI